MKAIIKDGAYPGVKLANMNKPCPKPDEVLIKVEAAAVCGTDMHYYHWNQGGQDFAKKFNVKWPFVLGHECSGTIVEVGGNVSSHSIGQRVALETHIPCGTCYQCQNDMPHNCANMGIYGTSCNGCFAEYTVAPAKVAFILPDSVSFEEGALLEPGGVAMRAVEESQVKPGDTVVVNGCGPVGLLAVMILKAGNAANVIATDIDEYRLNMARKMGAIAINVKTQDAVAEIQRLTALRGGADVVIEMSGSAASYNTLFDFIRLEGRLVTVGHPGGTIPISLMTDINLKGLQIKGVFGRRIWSTWWNLTSLISAKRINILDVVTHRFELSDCDKAFEQVTKGAGKVLFINK
ncbi:MAG TPA: alcohol dehydrogenase catalytic domain-containing protein [Bacillota bacterium]|nr:alcohol dehydrogenase catalytic domain-containing protein [Bacillota bacterium]HPL54361.1 alcohol dehydrogenase catalytic domain-containing protein [Bacillota bacterium]